MAKPIADFIKMRTQPEDFRLWNGLALYSVEGRPPPWGNNVWPAIITARARVRLAKEMERIRAAGGTVLYCDTDSIIYSGARGIKYPAHAEKPGTFESRGEYSKLFIAGKKEYGLQDANGAWEIHVKGVPAAAREGYLFTGKAEYQQPTRLREAARRGIKANVWGDKHKQRKVSFSDRAVRADGTLEPMAILPDSKKKPAKRGKKNG